MLIRKSGIILPKTHEKFVEVCSNLTRMVEDWNSTSTLLSFYEEFEDYVLIPRFYPIGEEVKDETDEGADIDIKSNVTPRSERQKLYIKEFTNRDNGILQAEPGVGKTVIATCIVSHYKKRSIIIAHKDKLLEQWESEFIKHTSLEKEDIGRLSGSNFEECLQKSIILTTPQVISYAVTKEKTEFLNAIQNANIGVLIIDECHVGVGPEKFSKASIFINAKRVYGLSATPSRDKETQDIIHKHLGDIYYLEPSDDELLKPNVFMLYLPIDVYKKNNRYFHWDGRFQLTRYYQQMYKAKAYHELLAKWIIDAYNKGRTVLILGNIIKPLLALAEECDLPPEDVGLFIPGARDKKYKKQTDKLTDTMDLSEAFHNKKVIYSTYGAARDGNNRIDLDVLIMYTPTNNPEQAIGRILRIKEGKKTPIVLDIVDTSGPEVYIRDKDGERVESTWFERSALKRIDVYEKKNWDIKIKKIDNINKVIKRKD